MIEWDDFLPSFYPYRFTRLITGTVEDPPVDRDLDNDWWIIYARGMTQMDNTLNPGHTMPNRWISETMLNVVTLPPPTDGATIACATPLLLALFTAIAVFVNRE